VMQTKRMSLSSVVISSLSSAHSLAITLSSIVPNAAAIECLSKPCFWFVMYFCNIANVSLDCCERTNEPNGNNRSKVNPFKVVFKQKKKKKKKKRNPDNHSPRSQGKDQGFDTLSSVLSWQLRPAYCAATGSDADSALRLRGRSRWIDVERTTIETTLKRDNPTKRNEQTIGDTLK
jgi:hypothetical protein